MCTRFVYRGGEMITGFNFDIDLKVWDHQVMKEPDCFYIGILRPDGLRHSYHGVGRNGNAGTLLYVHPNPAGADDSAAVGLDYAAAGLDCAAAWKEAGSEAASPSTDHVAISDLTEWFIRGRITFDEAVEIVKNKRIVYAPDASMQAMLSDLAGRTLIMEPGIGWQLEPGKCWNKPYSLITNYSLLKPESTRPFIVPGDDRYERAKEILEGHNGPFTVENGFELLKAGRHLGHQGILCLFSQRRGGVLCGKQ